MTGPSSLDGPDLRARVKGEIRRRMRQIRGALPERAWADKSREVCARALELDPIRSATTVAAYVPIKREVDPAGVLAAVRARGGRLALPRVVADDGRLAFHWIPEGTTLEAGPLGTSEPPIDAPTCETDAIDLVLVPALAVDPRGERIGYGRGYYDRSLAALGRAVRVVLAFDFQVIPEVPVTEGDEPVAFVVTDRRVIDCAASRSGSAGTGGT
ncbi:MAG: 5-formyltetrahydrofolate cyclo-ligase [Deltaproteobacteria bacterium]|nr:5-formyltetrahydrofolate cyclo-ligase [Deltaproteobacteria bacterium]